MADTSIPDINNSGLGKKFPAGLQDATGIAPKIFTVIIELAGAIFMLMLLFGGFQYLTGAGDEEKTGKAKKMMLDAVIGLVLTLLAYAIGKTVIGLLGG